MDLGRLRLNEWLAGLFGAGLLAVLFTDWYGPGGADAWESFAVTDVVLAIAGVLGVLALVLTASFETPAVSVAFETLAALVTTVASLFALVALLNLPDGAGHRELGVALGLPLTLGVAVSLWTAIHQERPGRAVPGGTVEVETLPAPDA
ncbi:MAG TPA: hypothetical protein VNT32_09970 [Thermoleophilaceae bacterium]|nr:hypothetical protein [Thermoleophilaceae bacterium]